MERAEACTCRQEIEQVKNKLIEAVTSGECQEEPPCITQHPGFHPVFINRRVPRTAWYQYEQQYKEPYEGWQDKIFRHIAYRQLARWCWGILGEQIRVVLPSCAVMCMRNFYPPPGLEEEFVFKGFKHADEWLTIDNTGRCLRRMWIGCSHLPLIFKYWVEYAIPFHT